MKRIVGAVLGLALMFGIGACGKEVDVKEVNATKVKGTQDLWWFCDGTTLIYIEKWSGDDEYVAFFSWGCTEEGKPTKELPGHLGDNGDEVESGHK